MGSRLALLPQSQIEGHEASARPLRGELQSVGKVQAPTVNCNARAIAGRSSIASGAGRIVVKGRPRSPPCRTDRGCGAAIRFRARPFSAGARRRWAAPPRSGRSAPCRPRPPWAGRGCQRATSGLAVCPWDVLDPVHQGRMSLRRTGGWGIGAGRQRTPRCGRRRAPRSPGDPSARPSNGVSKAPVRQTAAGLPTREAT